MKKFIIKISLLVIAPLTIVSCSSDALDPELSTVRDVGQDPIKSETDLMYLVNGMYKRMRSVAYYGRDFVIFNEARTDNAYSVGYSNRFVTITEMRVTKNDAYPIDTWRAMYQVILNANYVINSENITGDQDAIDDYVGQAYLGRALAHFDLTKLYGQQHVTGAGGAQALTVPFVSTFPTNSDQGLGFGTTRITLQEMRANIYADLDQAIAKISNTNAKAFTKQAAYGLKSRMALYFSTFFPEDKQVAYDSAMEALGMGGSVIPSANYLKQFLGNEIDVNSVFQLSMPSNDHLSSNSLAEMYSGEAYGDIVALPDALEIFLDENDVRTTVFGYDSYEDFRNMHKYNQYADDVIVMRYEEILLNAAEAASLLGMTSEATELINSLIEKRGIDGALELYSQVTLEDVRLERRKELMFEGFRYDDLLRYQENIPENPRLTGGVPYGDPKLAFPIPQAEINASGMIQNQGY